MRECATGTKGVVVTPISAPKIPTARDIQRTIGSCGRLGEPKRRRRKTEVSRETHGMGLGLQAARGDKAGRPSPEFLPEIPPARDILQHLEPREL